MDHTPEVEVDVDVLLTELKRVKDKELRLRAEKERVRKELEAIRTGDLWTRESATQRELEDIRLRKQLVQQKEREEAERLGGLSQTLKEKELTAQQNLRSKSKASLKQAASSIIGGSSTSGSSSDHQQEPGNLHEASVNQSSADIKPPRVSSSVRLQLSDRSKPTDFKQSSSADRVIATINLSEQEQRVQTLKEALELSTSRRGTDLLELPSVYVDRSQFEVTNDSRRASRRVESSSPRHGTSPSVVNRTKLDADSKNASPTQDHALGRGGPRIDLISQSPVQVPVGSDVPPNLQMQSHQAPSTHCQPVNCLPTVYALPWMAPSVMMPTLPPMISPYSMPYSPWATQSPTFFLPSYQPALNVLAQPPSQFTSYPPAQAQNISELEHLVNCLRNDELRAEDAKEYSKIEELLSALKSQVNKMARSESTETFHEKLNDDAETNPACETGIRALKRQQMEAVTRVRNERDLLEEQEKLDEMKDRIERRRMEREQTRRHEEAMIKQKEELMMLRLQRAVAKSNVDGEVSLSSLAILLQGDHSYNPDQGIVFSMDCATALPLSVETTKLSYAIYDGKIGQTSVKAIEARECEAYGPKHKRCVFATSRLLKNLPMSSDLRAIFEVSTWQQSLTTSQKPTTRSLGWTVLNFFRQKDRQLVLNSGFFKLHLCAPPMPDPSKVLLRSSAGESDGEMVLYCRIGPGDLEEAMTRTTIDPDAHAGLYHLPKQCLGSDQGSEASKQLVQPSTSTHNTANDQVVSPPDRALASTDTRDFLDVERLRLLSSSSNRPVSTYSRSVTTAIKDRARLQTVDERALETISDDVWVRVDKMSERQKRVISSTNFQPGDAFNVFIDGARCLPESTTVVKVTVAALNADRSRVPTQNSSQIVLSAKDTRSPSFDLCVELRERSFSPRLTLVVRLDTIDLYSKLPVILGYAVIPAFLDQETVQQPSRASITQFVLNQGDFQLPLHTSIEFNDAKEFDATCTLTFPRIPCATILLRIKGAVMSKDGLTILSRTQSPREEWAQHGLLDPAPRYHSGYYDSTACVPTAIETKMYQQLVQRKSISCAQVLERIGLTETMVDDSLKAKPQAFLDLQTAFPYHPELGFRVAVDGLHNIKAKAGTFFKVIFSAFPPASLYQPIRLTSDVHFTTSLDWSSLPTSPKFMDGYTTFRDVLPARGFAVIIDVRVLTRASKTGVFTSQPFAWSFLPILTEQGTVASGNFQLPLFAGPVNLSALESETLSIYALMDEIGTEKRKTQLPFIDGASVFVRLEDPQVPSTTGMKPMENATISKMIPPMLSLKYQYDSVKVIAAKKKTPLSKLLSSGMTEKQFEKEMNEAFAAEQGIRHYSF